MVIADGGRQVKRGQLPDQLLTLKQTGSRLGIGQTKLRELIDGDSLPVVRIGRAVRVSSDALDRWIALRTASA